MPPNYCVIVVPVIMVTRTVTTATGLLESNSQCFYGNMHNKRHDGPFILGDSPNSIKGAIIDKVS